MILVDVFVPGAVKTKGSMKVRNKATGAMKESVAGSSQWRALMAGALRDDIARRQRTVAADEVNPPGWPYPGPVSVTVVAYLRSPTPSVGPSRPWLWPVWTRAGDLDKIVRNVLDALGSTSRNPKMNGGVIVDDNLVCHLSTWKRVAHDCAVPGVCIRVSTDVPVLELPD